MNYLETENSFCIFVVAYYYHSTIINLKVIWLKANDGAPLGK